MKEIDTEILIVGSGLVGLVAAHSLLSLKYNVVLIDKKTFKKIMHLKFKFKKNI